MGDNLYWYETQMYMLHTVTVGLYSPAESQVDSAYILVRMLTWLCLEGTDCRSVSRQSRYGSFTCIWRVTSQLPPNKESVSTVAMCTVKEPLHLRQFNHLN
jgi:hypothetical protein